MKMTMVLVLSFLTQMVCATEIISAQFDPSQQQLTLELAFTGGSQEHQFSLLWDPCQVRNGQQEIAARLVDTGHSDTGREEFFQTLKFDLSSLQCKPAWLTIRSGRFSHKTLWIN
jgi:hypothetical protein